jgi:hypothetical protein
MLEHKRANEDRLQDNFEQLLSRSVPTEKSKVFGAEIVKIKNPLTSVIAPNLLYMVTDIVIPCEIIDEEETTVIKQCDESKSPQAAECDLETPDLSKSGHQVIVATRFDETPSTILEFSFEQTVKDTVVKALSKNNSLDYSNTLKEQVGRLSVFPTMQHTAYDYHGSLFTCTLN